MTHRFGGDWTTEKLSIVARYLSAYTTALKDKPSSTHPFVKGYIDAFAGTGYRHLASESSPDQTSLFTAADAEEPEKLLKGSARLALETDPRFDRYIFIESRADRCAQLEALKEEFPALAPDISVLPGDCNQVIRNICQKDWRSHRAVLFLDPYGMQVEWPTIQAIGSTKAIDLWVLWPLGIAVNRMLTRSGDIPEALRRSLDRLLGTTDWYEAFYSVTTSVNLFGEETDNVVKATTESIGQYLNARLRTAFVEVAANPRVLRNSTGCPIYLLCFAAGNEKGAPIAMRIAEHLLKRGAL